MSGAEGDGGLHPGRLVFSEQFENFTGQKLEAVIKEIAGGRSEAVRNIGGPSIVALIHAAQLLQETGAQIAFHGLRAADKAGQFVKDALEQLPLNIDHLGLAEGFTPTTIVLSDPRHNQGLGERIFINQMGAAWNLRPEHLGDDFFDSDIVAFGGTALVPRIHDALTALLDNSKSKGCVTVVNTVYDFRSELEHPGDLWKLGSGNESYGLIDLLITDYEEALKLSGAGDAFSALSFFRKMGVSSCIITNGTRPTSCFSDGRVFSAMQEKQYPVSYSLVDELKNFQGGDTTGCGDNFAGGVLASLAWQLMEGKEHPDLEEAIAWGTVSGGFCCFQIGGSYQEKKAGEKLKRISSYYRQYREQIHG